MKLSEIERITNEDSRRGQVVEEEKHFYNTERFVTMAREQMPKLIAVAKAAQELRAVHNEWCDFKRHGCEHRIIALNKALEELEK